MMEIAIPVLLAEFTKYMEGDELPEYMTQMWALKIAMTLLLLKVFKHTLWENICYKMILCGHWAHGALKQIIFEKTFRMSTASNKDYSQGEIMNLIHRDSGRVWSFVWELNTIIETPFEMIIAAYFLWTNLGYSSFTGVFLYAILFFVNRYKSKLHKKTWGVIDRKRDKRMQQTAEAFHNAKMLKLYGWEQPFQASVSKLYEEENEMQRKQDNMNRVVNFIPGFIDRMLPLIVFCTYVYFGNKITMSQIVICETMIRRFNGNISHIIHKYHDIDNLKMSLHKVHDFIAANENQKGVIAKKENADSDIAVKIKGNFCRGIP